LHHNSALFGELVFFTDRKVSFILSIGLNLEGLTDFLAVSRVYSPPVFRSRPKTERISQFDF